MRQFDEFLRQGLMEANLAEYRENMDQLPEPEFSPRYRRERMRLLADPWKWVKRRERPMWKRIAKNVACVLLACTVAFGALMAASPAVRAAVNTWLREITWENGYLSIFYTPSDPARPAPQSSWRLSRLPEGWALDTIDHTVFDGRWELYKLAPDGIDGMGMSFTWISDINSNVGLCFFNESQVSPIQTTVHGRPAEYYEGNYQKILTWEAEDGTLLSIQTSENWLDRAALEQVAENIVIWTGSTTEYEVHWVPEGSVEYSAAASSGDGYHEWTIDNAVFAFQYVNDPICPFRVPNRTPEQVLVNGRPGLYWPSLVSMEERRDFASDGISFYGTGVSAVLTWEDPETNTIFRIDGIQEKEDMLRMAESVTRKTS